MKYGVMLACIPSNSFELFQCSYKKVRREFLDQEELDLLYKKEFTVKRSSRRTSGGCQFLLGVVRRYSRPLMNCPHSAKNNLGLTTQGSWHDAGTYTIRACLILSAIILETSLKKHGSVP